MVLGQSKTRCCKFVLRIHQVFHLIQVLDDAFVGRRQQGKQRDSPQPPSPHPGYAVSCRVKQSGHVSHLEFAANKQQNVHFVIQTTADSTSSPQGDFYLVYSIFHTRNRRVEINCLQGNMKNQLLERYLFRRQHYKLARVDSGC